MQARYRARAITKGQSTLLRFARAGATPVPSSISLRHVIRVSSAPLHSQGARWEATASLPLEGLFSLPTLISAEDKSSTVAPSAKAPWSAAISDTRVHSASALYNALSQRGARVIFSKSCFRLSQEETWAISWASAARNSSGE